ncbi:MAG: GTPase ObgE [Flavobacteriales bacterium AspAUS03]
MSEKNFIDYVKIYCRSGDGGAGAIHFHREKFITKGGPDGGDGGKGGDIILQGDHQRWTLLHLKYQKHHRAGHGRPGGSNRLTGANAKNIVINVPIGTVVKDEKGQILFEITQDGQKEVLLKGGQGGQGNWHFRSATRQAPHYAQPGVEGIEEWFILELKVLADVGLIGFPNAGKSTLLSMLTAAKPKIAGYAFTTLTPHLGIVPYQDQHSFIMADIPGLIKGAAQGKGLGHRFLRHIERNTVLLFMIPVNDTAPKKVYEILLDELREYNPNLLNKQHLLVISKSDLLDDASKKRFEKELTIDRPYIFISSFTKQGLEKLKDELWKMIHTSIVP